MRAIHKKVEPPTLTQHRQAPHSDYDNFQDKDTLRQALVTEQRGLCCYCMGPIRAARDEMKIEHWRCQAYYRSEQLNYRNLLGACPGGEGQPGNMQHCDTRKGDKALKWNPANPLHQIESRVRYEPDGSIRGNEAEFDDQLNDVLNLNLPILKARRKSVLDGVLEGWKRKKDRLKGPVPRDHLIRRRDQYVAGDGPLKPYCQVAVWWLNRRITRMAR